MNNKPQFDKNEAINERSYINVKLDKFYKGEVIRIGQNKYFNEIQFIRAAYGRSCAVCRNGSVYIWGQGLRNERLVRPKLIFTEPDGIKDLRFRFKHGLYINAQNHQVYSWGDSSFGQTGNNQVEGSNALEEDKSYQVNVPKRKQEASDDRFFTPLEQSLEDT